MPVMSAIATNAKNNGELVYAYQQGDAEYNYKDIGPWGAVRNGYCAALSFKWIAQRLRGDDLPYDPKTLFAEKEDWRIARLHNLTKDVGYDPVMAELGLQRAGAGVTYLGIPSALQIVPPIVSTECDMVQYKREGGGHLVAIQYDGKLWRYFDANYGEFAFRSKDRFINWYQAFLSDSGYRNRYTVMVIVTQITWKSGGSVRALRGRFGG